MITARKGSLAYRVATRQTNSRSKAEYQPQHLTGTAMDIEHTEFNVYDGDY